MSQKVTVMPAAWVATGHAVPAVCSRHGQPPVARQRTTIASPTPEWAYVLILFGVVIFFVARAFARQTIAAPNWPYCQACLRRRKVHIVAGVGTIAAGVALVVAAFTVFDTPALVLVGLLVFAASGFVFSGASWARVAGAQLSPDRAWVEVSGSSSEFEAQFALHRDAALAAAAAAQPEGARLQTAPPIVVKRLGGWWYAVLIVGILIGIAGVGSFVMGPTCGSERMRPGDICETTQSSGRVVVSTYDSDRQLSYWASGVGIALALAGGWRISAWRKNARRAWAAAHASQAAAGGTS